MKQKLYILYILVISFMLTGCTINYKLDFRDGKIFENITGSVSNDEAISEVEGRNDINPIYYYLYLDNEVLINSDEEYDKRITDNENSKDFEFNYVYNNNYKDSKVINNCFENHIVEETDEYYYIRLSGKFYCKYVEKLNINVTSDYKVLSNNAKKVNKNNYSWIIDNSDNVDISLTISKSLRYAETPKPKLFSTFQLIGIIIFSILTVLTYILYKRKNSGKI